MTAFEKVHAALDEHGCLPNAWRPGRDVHCPHPNHQDSRPSLSFDEGEECVLLHCHAGCATEEIVTALGLTMRSLYDHPRTGGNSASRGTEIDSAYDYTDSEGNLLYQIVRFRRKNFRARRPLVSQPRLDVPDDWAWGRGECDRVPYRLPELLEAVGKDRVIHVVEGEGLVDRLWTLGYPATCNPFGAGKWRKEWADLYFAAADVVCFPDNDGPGCRHMQTVADSLIPVAKEIRVVQLPGVKPKGDVGDWLGNHTTEELDELVLGTPLWVSGSPLHPSEPPRKGWGKIDIGIIESGLHLWCKLLYIFLAARQGKHGYATFGQSYVADRLGWNRKTVGKYAVILEGFGLIKVTREGTKKDVYEVIHNPPWDIVNPNVTLPLRQQRARRKSRYRVEASAEEMAKVAPFRRPSSVEPVHDVRQSA